MSKTTTLLNRVIGFKMNIRLIQAIFIIFLTAVFVIVSVGSYAENVTRIIADNLIRFHVVANSDSTEDQQLKMLVRDNIIEYMNCMLKDSKNIQHTRRIIAENIPIIENIAQQQIKKSGRDYKVSVSLGEFAFPTKVYGDVALPAGKYEALQIVIGEGTGKNWWCVLFPPLCFIDATHATIPESVKNDLKQVLPADEYNMITTAIHPDKVPIRIKFKIVEMYQQSQIKIAGKLSKLIMMTQ